MRVVWKKGFDQSKVTDNNYISLTQFEYAVFFEENYEEEIASGKYLTGVNISLFFAPKLKGRVLKILGIWGRFCDMNQRRLKLDGPRNRKFWISETIRVIKKL